MKFIISLFILFFFSVCENYEDQFNWSYAEKKWTEANMIEKKITGAAIVEKSFNVLDYKIIPDGNTINTNLINNLIDTVSQEGGGRINFPSGTYLTGGLILKNNIEIHLEHDAILKFSQNPVDYTPNVIGHWEGMEINNFRAFIYSNGAENIAITGNGILDGNAGWDNWWDWSKKNLHKLDKNRPRLMGYNRDQVDVSERNFGLGYNLRPNFIQLYKSKNITIKDVTLKNSPMWNIHTVLSENIIIDGVKIFAPYMSPNTDAIDLESSKNIIVKNCFIDVGDDCITIKSGRNQDGRRIDTATENVIARNNIIKNGRGGLTIGSEISGGANNIFMEDCQINSKKLNRAFRIKSSEVRGGHVRNIFIRDVAIDTVGGGPVLNIDLHYTVRDAERDGILYLPKVENVFIQDVQCNYAKQPLFLDGYQNSKINNIRLKNIFINDVFSPSHIKDVSNLFLEEFNIYNRK
tara:strand:- start:2519 stop:3910 length:1392 start_codon:yes stop_codon:yes gene_type:complete